MAITINAALKRDLVLNQGLTALKKKLTPILAFATKFSDVPLLGTNKVSVPYYSLASGASTDFVQANGYVMSGNQTISVREVTVNKRKYRPFSFTSEEFSRQPFLSASKLFDLEVDKLADDIITDVFSVVTATNYPSTTLAAQLASAFDLDDALAMRELCTKAYWPLSGRSLVLDTAPGLSLMKDSRLGFANSQSTAQVTEGFPNIKIAGFTPIEVPNLPANGAEKIMGMAVFPSALMFASAPIMPTPEVARMIEFRKVTDTETGLTMVYRSWADPDFDVTREVVEVSYGYSVGESDALKRITVP